MKISGALIEALVNLLRSIGLLGDPNQEVEVRRSLADLEKTKAQVWVDFVRATSPDPNRVYVWANTIIALIRPAISLLIVLGMLFAPSRILDLVRTFGEAGPSGWIILSPILWWFLGRDVNKVLAMHYGGAIEVGSGASAPASRPREDTDAVREWWPKDRVTDDGLILEPEFDRPPDR